MQSYEKLKELREDSNCTQSDIARLLNVSQQYYHYASEVYTSFLHIISLLLRDIIMFHLIILQDLSTCQGSCINFVFLLFQNHFNSNKR